VRRWSGGGEIAVELELDDGGGKEEKKGTVVGLAR